MTAPAPVHWITAFLDRPAESFKSVSDYWCAVTGSTLSPRRGQFAEFATFLPPVGAPSLKLQGVGQPSQGGHLDLDVVDLADATRRAVELGARSVADLDTLQVLRSPAGLTFCLVPPRTAAERAPATDTPGGRIRADQFALDVGPAAYDAEIRFWAALTGWEVVPSVLPEFTLVVPPAALPIRLLIQRLGEEPAEGPRVHLDLACSDVGAAAAYHRSLGGSVVAEHEFWTVMRDPADALYCLTGRDPDTGRLRRG